MQNVLIECVGPPERTAWSLSGPTPAVSLSQGKAVLHGPVFPIREEQPTLSLIFPMNLLFLTIFCYKFTRAFFVCLF